MRNIDSIIVHCSATKAGLDFTATDIDRWHRERGFNGIGYHYVIRLDGRLEKGREIDLPGAHCKRGGMSLWPVLIVRVGMSEVSGYVISADWMRTGVRQIPGRMLKNGCFIRLLWICSGNIIFSKCWDIGILHRI